MATEEGRKLKRCRTWVLFVSGLVLGLIGPHDNHAAPKIQLVIVYTNDVLGEVEPCG